MVNKNKNKILIIGCLCTVFLVGVWLDRSSNSAREPEPISFLTAAPRRTSRPSLYIPPRPVASETANRGLSAPTAPTAAVDSEVHDSSTGSGWTFWDRSKEAFWRQCSSSRRRTEGTTHFSNTNNRCEWHHGASGTDAEVRAVSAKAYKAMELLDVQSVVIPALAQLDLAKHAATYAAPTSAVPLSDAQLQSFFYPARAAESSTEGTLVPQRLVSPKECLHVEGKGGSGKQSPPSILFIGHSHTRYIAAMLCMMVNHSDCGLFGLHRRNATVMPRMPQDSPSSLVPPWMVWIQANYDLRRKLGKYFSRPSRHHDGGNGTKSGNTTKGAIVPFPGGKQPVLWAQELAGNRSVSDSMLSIEAKEVATEELKQRVQLNATFSDIVVSRGAWDLLFYDRLPSETMRQLTLGLEALARRFPPARVTLHLPHHVQNRVGSKPTAREGKSKLGVFARAQWRAQCFSPGRIRMMRNVNLCSFAAASARHIQRQNHDGEALPSTSGGLLDAVPTLQGLTHQQCVQSKLPFRLYDVFHSTDTVFGGRYADGLGHHYLDIVLEAMTQQLLAQQICTHSSRGENNDGDASLDRVCHFLSQSAVQQALTERCTVTLPKELDLHFTNVTKGPIEACACHRPEFRGRKSKVCAGYGKYVPLLDETS